MRSSSHPIAQLVSMFSTWFHGRFSVHGLDVATTDGMEDWYEGDTHPGVPYVSVFVRELALALYQSYTYHAPQQHMPGALPTAQASTGHAPSPSTSTSPSTTAPNTPISASKGRKRKQNHISIMFVHLMENCVLLALPSASPTSRDGSTGGQTAVTDPVRHDDVLSIASTMSQSSHASVHSGSRSARGMHSSSIARVKYTIF